MDLQLECIVLSNQTMSSSSSSTSDDQRGALLDTLRGYKVRTAPSQLFPGQCGVVALAPIAKGESVFPCNGELSSDTINLTFEEVASLPSHSRKLVWAFFQPNQDPRSVPREELTFPVPVNGLVHVGNSFFCNSADGAGQDANVETGTKIDGSGYAELLAMRDIQVGEELLDSYPIWNYGGSGEFLTAVDDGVDAVELLGFGVSDDEAQEILDVRRHMASLKAKVARLEELRDIDEGKITVLKRQNTVLKRQVDSTASENCQLRTKMARLTEAHRREISVASSNSRLWWGCVNRIHSAGTFSYRDTSTTESESDDDDGVVACRIAQRATDYQACADGDDNVDIGTLCLDNDVSERVASSDDKPSLVLREIHSDDDGLAHSAGTDLDQPGGEQAPDNNSNRAAITTTTTGKKIDSFRHTPNFIDADKNSPNRQWYGLNIAKSKGTRQKLYVAMYAEAKKRDDYMHLNPILPPDNGTTKKIIDDTIPDPSGAEFVLERDFQDKAFFSLMNGIIADELKRIGAQMTSLEQTDEFGAYWANSSHRGLVRTGRYLLKNSKLEYFWHYIRPRTNNIKEAICKLEQEQTVNARRKLAEKKKRIRGTSTTESERDDDDGVVAGRIAQSTTDYQACADGDDNVDIGTPSLDNDASERVASSDDSSLIADKPPLVLREIHSDDDGLAHSAGTDLDQPGGEQAPDNNSNRAAITTCPHQPTVT